MVVGIDRNRRHVAARETPRQAEDIVRRVRFSLLPLLQTHSTMCVAATALISAPIDSRFQSTVANSPPISRSAARLPSLTNSAIAAGAGVGVVEK